MSRYFISYRRDDSAYVAGMIADRLTEEFGPDVVYIDVDAIPVGIDFVEHIVDAVKRCDVLLAIIGDHWLNATDQSGSRRLDDPNDFVRLEVDTALNRKIPVVPVLVGRAQMPKPHELPPELRMLAYRNGTEVRAGRDLKQHLEGLISNLLSLRRGRRPRINTKAIRYKPVSIVEEEIHDLLIRLVERHDLRDRGTAKRNLQDLILSEKIEDELAKNLQKFIGIANRIHYGAVLTNTAADWARNEGPKLLLELENTLRTC